MDDLTPTQWRSMELAHKMLPIIQGENANAVAGALTFHLGVAIGKCARTEAEAVKMAKDFGGDIARTALDMMTGGNHDV